jgi:hypothetical protein
VQRRRATCCCGKHLLLWKAVRRGGGRLPLEQKRVQVMYTNCREANPSANTANPYARRSTRFSQRSRQRRDHHLPGRKGQLSFRDRLSARQHDAERACRSPARTLPPGERDEGVPAPLLAEAVRAAQVRDALQAGRQENAALLSACEELLSACEEKTKEALRVLVEEERSAEHFSVPVAGGRTLPPGEARAATAACRATAAKATWQGRGASPSKWARSSARRSPISSGEIIADHRGRKGRKGAIVVPRGRADLSRAGGMPSLSCLVPVNFTTAAFRRFHQS